MIKFKEPLDKLIRAPKEFTKHLKFPSPEKIKIYDDTLRDGEQMPGVAFSPAQKLELAIFLSDMGVDVMDVAFPVNGRSDREALKLIVKAQGKGKIRRDIEILAMCRSSYGDVDIVLDTLKEIGARADDVSILVLSTFSDLHVKYKLGKTLLKREERPVEEWISTDLEFYRRANIDMICDTIKYAKDKGISRVEFASEDSSRGNIEYGVRWAKACVKAGGTRMCFSDTCGVFTPEAVDYYIPKMIKALDGVPMTAHFHNDFGLSALNTVRAVSHGAEYMGLTANGIGERAGNTSIHQTVMVLKELYGVTLPRFKYDKLTELRRLVERHAGIPVQAHEPIVGEGVFSHESGIHAAGILINPAIYQFIREETVGGEQRFVFGKHSGLSAVEDVLKKNKSKLEKSGIAIEPELVERLLERAKELREERISGDNHEGAVRDYYAAYKKLGISEDELIEIAINEFCRKK